MRTVNGCGSGERPIQGAAEGAKRRSGESALISQAKGQSKAAGTQRRDAAPYFCRSAVLCEPEPCGSGFLFAAKHKKGV